MSSYGRNLTIGVIAAVLIALAMIVAFLWPRAIDETEMLAAIELESPAELSPQWQQTSARESIVLSIDSDGPVWSSEDGQTLLRGPSIEGLRWDWTEGSVDEWTVLIGVGLGDDLEVHARIWSSPNLPAAIIDVDAIVSGPALASPLFLQTEVDGRRAEIITAALQRRRAPEDSLSELSILAGRFPQTEPTVQIHSSPAAVGQIRPSSSNQVAIDWSLFLGLPEFSPCFEGGEFSERASLRLVVQFGDHPTVVPLPHNAGIRAMGTPIFVDPPRRSQGAWADGRARDGDEFALRLRALAFGHSDRDDARYGNGGLLAAGMGAVFAIPSQWWELESIAELRNSLADTGIEVIPDDALDEAAPYTSTRLVPHADCSLLGADNAGEQGAAIIISDTDSDETFQNPMAAALPPIFEVGRAGIGRAQLLDRLFEIDHRQSLFVRGEHRALLIPLVATRNPLEEIAAQEILSPDRRGHWTLDDSLTRRLSLWEMIPENRPYQSISFQALGAHRARQASALLLWEPDGSLWTHGDNGEETHLLIVGDEENIRFPGTDRYPGLTWSSRAEDLPAYQGALVPLSIEWSLD